MEDRVDPGVRLLIRLRVLPLKIACRERGKARRRHDHPVKRLVQVFRGHFERWGARHASAQPAAQPAADTAAALRRVLLNPLFGRRSSNSGGHVRLDEDGGDVVGRD